MERSRSTGSWLFDKDEIAEALKRAVDGEAVAQAIDEYIEEQMYNARLLAGSSIIDEIDRYDAAVREGGIAPGLERLKRAAYEYINIARQVEYDDYPSVEFYDVARGIADDPASGVENAREMLEDIREELILQGFAFDNMDQGEDNNVSTD